MDGAQAGNPFWNRATFPHTHRIYIYCGIDMCSMCSMNVSFFDTNLFFLLIILSLFFFPKKKSKTDAPIGWTPMTDFAQVMIASSKSAGLPRAEFETERGIYVVDFQQSVQYPMTDPAKRRQVRYRQDANHPGPGPAAAAHAGLPPSYGTLGGAAAAAAVGAADASSAGSLAGVSGAGGAGGRPARSNTEEQVDYIKAIELSTITEQAAQVQTQSPSFFFGVKLDYRRCTFQIILISVDARTHQRQEQRKIENGRSKKPFG